MITASGRDFVRWAMQDLAVLAAGEVPSSGEAQDGLELLNLVADALGIERLLLYKIVRTTKTLASGTASYTIGSGGAIAMERPLWITKAGLVLDTAADPTTEVPIDVLDAEQYAAWPSKNEDGQARAIFYDYGFGAVTDTDRGTLYVLPVPDTGTTQLVLYTPGGEVSQFADVDTDYTFPKGYGYLLRKVLALELAPMYPQATVSRLLERQAAHARRTLKSANLRPAKRRNSPMLTGGGTFDQDAGIFR